MKYLTRYDPISTIGMIDQPDGQFVKFEDYLKERQSLTRSRDNLLAIVTEVSAVVKRDQNKETVVEAVRRVMKGGAAITRTFKRGDSVFHRPSGETWYLIEDERGGWVTPGGWPASQGRAEDCKLVTAVEDREPNKDF